MRLLELVGEGIGRSEGHGCNAGFDDDNIWRELNNRTASHSSRSDSRTEIASSISRHNSRLSRLPATQYNVFTHNSFPFVC